MFKPIEPFQQRISKKIQDNGGFKLKIIAGTWKDGAWAANAWYGTVWYDEGGSPPTIFDIFSIAWTAMSFKKTSADFDVGHDILNN